MCACGLCTEQVLLGSTVMQVEYIRRAHQTGIHVQGSARDNDLMLRVLHAQASAHIHGYLVVEQD